MKFSIKCVVVDMTKVLYTSGNKSYWRFNITLTYPGCPDGGNINIVVPGETVLTDCKPGASYVLAFSAA